MLSTRHAHSASVVGSCTAFAAAAMAAGPCRPPWGVPLRIEGDVLARSVLLRPSAGRIGKQRCSAFTVQRAEPVNQTVKPIVLALVPRAATAQGRDAVAYCVFTVFRNLQRGVCIVRKILQGFGGLQRSGS